MGLTLVILIDPVPPPSALISAFELCEFILSAPLVDQTSFGLMTTALNAGA